MITAQVETVDGMLAEAMALLPQHYNELALHKALVPLEPRYEVYRAKEASGELLIVTVRRNGTLVGYWITFIGPGLHYKTCLTGTFDIFYIVPEARRSVAALLLGRKVEAELRKRGVQRWYAGEKLAKPEAGKLYQLLGMAPVETFYCKWLGD